jgi:hypothetical protein
VTQIGLIEIPGQKPEPEHVDGEKDGNGGEIQFDPERKTHD